VHRGAAAGTEGRRDRAQRRLIRARAAVRADVSGSDYEARAAGQRALFGT
jgi:hypothetical protein